MSTELSGCVPVDSDGRILLIHRETPEISRWEVIGGKPEPGEDPEQTAFREAEEEIGTKVRIVRRLGEQTFYEGGQGYPYTWWLAVIEHGRPYPQERMHDRVEWFRIGQLMGMDDLSPNLQNLLKKIVDGEVGLTI